MKKPYSKYLAEQKCNYFKRRLKTRIEDGADYEELHNLATLIDIYSWEIEEDYIYLDDKKIEVTSIDVILYYEGVYGKKIYEKPKN